MPRRQSGPGRTIRPVPEHKQGRFRYEREKFAAAGLTPVSAELAAPPRVAK
ncbi:hypothetical protein [Kribbella solani]|uniref:Uncharacterized protein n=1 Tax=Kribbella solani TaxID=236067 RepID=A0A841DWM3_9ACTN|nr:hypothetical protein [Kribbella solani]MBB5981150.1 hypothetical protein [Kribbella solani]